MIMKVAYARLYSVSEFFTDTSIRFFAVDRLIAKLTFTNHSRCMGLKSNGDVCIHVDFGGNAFIVNCRKIVGNAKRGRIIFLFDKELIIRL